MKAHSKTSDFNKTENVVYQEEEQELLQRLSDKIFSGDREKLALALGRSETEIERLLNGEMKFDEDLIEKVNRLLDERALS